MTTSEFSAALTQPKWKLLLIVAVLGLGFALHERLVAPILFAVSNLWSIAPIMLAGLLVTAVLTATGSIAILVGTFNSRELSAIVMVSLIGSVLPVCGITLLPLVARLLAAGAPLAPVMAFLLSSAVIDPQMFAITAATLGLPFAIGKTVAALGIGVLGGIATWAMVRLGQFHHPMRQSSMLRSLVPQSACGGSTEVQWRFWQDPRRLTAFRDTCWSVGKLVVLFLGAAFVAEYFLKLYLPDDALTDFLGQDSLLAIPIASIIGAPLYLDGYAALPLVRGLIDHGMGQGAAMAFLIAGGITSAWTAIPVFALVRLPVFLAYVVMAVVGSTFSGLIYALIIV